MKKRLLKLLLIGVLTAGFIYFLNRLSDHRADRKNTLPMTGRFFTWRDYDIFYNVRGSGKPMLLIHDLHPASCNYEWTKLARRLDKDYEVYGVDLLGCGRSDKPAITYTTYLYAEMLNSFIEQIIKEKVTIIASGSSSFIALTLNKLYREKIEKVILINPDRLTSAEAAPDQKRKLLKTLISLPIIGTYIFNIENTEKNLSNLFRERYYQNPKRVDDKIVEAYYEAAHRGHGTGRFLLASLRGHYLNTNIKNTLKDTENLCIISSRDRRGSYQIMEEYRKYAKKAETTSISGSRTLPQLETPDKLMKAIKLFL